MFFLFKVHEELLLYLVILLSWQIHAEIKKKFVHMADFHVL